MRIRTRLSLAFFLISVVPLGLVTAYSYYSSAAALRRAVEGQADQMAAEMGDRMAWVMTDLGDRVGRLWRMRVDSPAAAAAADPPPRSPMNRPSPSCAPSRRPCWPRPLPWCAASSSNRRRQRRLGGTATPVLEGPPLDERSFGPRGGGGRRGPGSNGRPPMGSPASESSPSQPRFRAEGGPPGRPGAPGATGVPVVAPGMPRVVIEMPAVNE